MYGKEKEKLVFCPLASKGLVFDDKPLWNHVTVLSMGSGGGNRTWSCNYCGKKVTGSYSRVTAHLLRHPNKGVLVCRSIGDDEVATIKKNEQESADCRKAQQEQNARKVSVFVSLPSGPDLKQPKKRKGALETSFNVADTDIAGKVAARMFYACGLPFNLARSPYYRKYIQIVANSRLAGYTPPSFDRLRTTLLKQEKEHINRLVQPIKDTWRKKGLSLVSDGWSDLHRRPPINIMAASSGGSMFLKSIGASGQMKDGEYVANLFIEAIKDVGESNVVQVITDNASNYKAAGMIVEEKFPHLLDSLCCA